MAKTKNSNMQEKIYISVQEDNYCFWLKMNKYIYLQLYIVIRN